jgi:hypothetical protein
VLLLSGAGQLASQPVLEVVHELAERQVEVHLATWAAPTSSLLAAVSSAVVWGPVDVVPDTAAADEFTGPADPADFTATTDVEVRPSRVPARLRPYQRQATRVLDRLRRVGHAGRAWRRVRADDRLVTLAGTSDVIVAIETQAVLSAWHLARRFPQPEVIYGLSAARGVILRSLDG